MDFTILAVVLLLCGGIPLRNKIYKEQQKSLIYFIFSFLIRSRFLPKNRFMKMYGDMTIRQTLII